MTLRQLLTVFDDNKGTSVTLMNLEGVDILTFIVEGFMAVESDILDRGVKKVTIIKTPTAASLKITLYDPVDDGPTPDNTNG